MATPQEIVTGAACFSCIPDSWAALVYEFDQIRINGGGSVMTPAEISAASSCYKCIPDQWAALLYLADQIVTNGGGGGGGGTTIQFSAASDPSGVPVGNARVWVRLDNGKLWIYNTGTAAWDPYLG